MRVGLDWGLQHTEVEVPDAQIVPGHRAPYGNPLQDPAEAVRKALEKPFGFPALRYALTPDDHVAIVVDETLPQVASLLVPILEHLQKAGVSPQGITLVCLPPTTGQPWLEDLPDEFQDVQVEIHDPTERKKLAYLATTRKGRRVYLNRTVVDADQSILLTRRGYDSVMGYSGGEGALYPALSDDPTRQETANHFSRKAPGMTPWATQLEAQEVAWLLGAPFLVQIIPDRLDQIAAVVAGPMESCGEGQRLLDDRWRIEVEEPVDVVIGTIGGDPSRHTFADLARGFAAGARAVHSEGSVVLLTEADPNLGRAAEILRNTDDPGRALKILAEEKPQDHEAGYLWALAAQQAKLYLLSKWPDEVAEELFAVPLQHPGQISRILRERPLFVPDIHQSLVTIRRPNHP